MASESLRLIRQYCDTTGRHLSNAAKTLLCKILENPARYDGFISELRIKHDSGRDYRDTWASTEKWQYKIEVGPPLTIRKRWYHECDGYEQDAHWSWDNAWSITDIRRIIEILGEIKSEL